MQIEMIGIDYNSASVELRERFSLTASGGAKLADTLRQQCGADGIVVLSTCNRTEIWCSNAKRHLLDSYFAQVGLSETTYAPYFVHRENQLAVAYLLELACGMHSQIFGEDQILSQIKEALRCAREQEQTDPVLETLFRTALTAAKKVKTQVQLQEKDHSVPERALTVLERNHGSLAGRQCLVIGNGEMGRLLCKLLRACGCVVYLTTRRYHHHDTIVPEGCTAVPYESRYDYIAQADFVFSATVSPHYTVKQSCLLPRKQPGNLVIVDLAVPRDVEPQVGELSGVTLYNMDKMGLDIQHNEAAIAEARQILREAADDFYRWQDTRLDALSVREIGQAAAALTNQKLTRVFQTQAGTANPEQVARAAEKAVEKLLFDLRDAMEIEDWSRCVEAMRNTTAQWD